MKILITGGAGFIGTALIHHLMRHTTHDLINLDNLTYASCNEALACYENSQNYHFVKGDIADENRVKSILEEHKPTVIMHLAAESHVDRSIESAMPFVTTNVLGTVVLLTQALNYWRAMPLLEQEKFRFHHISTDEVYGSLGDNGFFKEQTPYDPRSPYSASKAASDHFVSAFYHTYGLPVLITNCSNNYGPHQFPEKLIPLTILKCLKKQPIPVYGQGLNIRDWLYVEDHVKGLLDVVQKGTCGEKYNLGGDAERKNIDVVRTICTLMDEKHPPKEVSSYHELIHFVEDRPGHDLRYAIDHSKISKALGWAPQTTFEQGLAKTIDWYLQNQQWLEQVYASRYSGQRIGLS